MSELTIAAVVFACVLGGAVLGMTLRRALPEHHLSDETKDIMKLGTGLLATLSALVLGLLISSANGSYNVKADEVKQSAVRIILIDRNLRHYGPEANDLRGLLRRSISVKADAMWSEAGDKRTSRNLAWGGSGIEEVQDGLRGLVPTNDAQRWLQARALQLSGEVAQTRWLIAEQRASSIPQPFLVLLVLWLVVIFLGFGMFAPGHGTAFAVILTCALSVSSAIYLILELDRPFEGLLKISDMPLRDAVAEMSR